jgi:hypothetical protein
MASSRSTSNPVPTVAGSAAGSTGSPAHRVVAVRWARRWPYATAALIAVAIWFATSAILVAAVPAAPPAIGMVGFFAGVVIGTGLTGLEGARRWVVVPVITLAIWLILGGATLAIWGARPPS